MSKRHSVFSPSAGYGLALAIAVTSASHVRADGGGKAVRWHRDASDPRWVQGDVTVNAPPDVVWARLASVDDWTHTLTDVASLKVLDRRTDDRGHTRWKIELETRTLGHGMLGYEVDSDPARSLLLSTDRMGVRAVAQTLVRSGPTPNQSNVVYSLFIELSWLPSLLISEKSLRQKQEHMVDVTLGDIGRAFPKPAAAPAPPAAYGDPQKEAR
jgi:hypothetical protein